MHSDDGRTFFSLETDRRAMSGPPNPPSFSFDIGHYLLGGASCGRGDLATFILGNDR